MNKAVSSVKDGVSIRRAAEQFNVPKSTLGDRVSGRVQLGSRSGPKTYLSDHEEKELATFLIRCGSIGYPRTKAQTLALVQRILETRGFDGTLSTGWWTSFRKRHPEVVLRSSSQLSAVRSRATDVDMLDRYFDLLEETLTSYDLLHSPAQVYNMDESGMPLDPKPPKLIFQRGCQHAAAFSSGNKKQITVVGCVNAAGNVMPPMVIWARKTLPPELAIGEVPGSRYGLSTKGWIDHELFDNWFHKHFLNQCTSARPILLLLDGHSSHYCPDTIKLAAQQQVIMFALPPNTTHLTQPLDKGCFGPLKKAWKVVCHDFLTANPGQVVTCYNFSALLRKAWEASMVIPNVLAGFRVTGIFPVDRDVLLNPIKESLNEPTATAPGLEYIPLLSPYNRKRVSRIAHSTTASNTSDENFDSTDVARFSHWFTKGIPIRDNHRYSAWLAKYHPQSAAAAHVWMCPTQTESLFKLPPPPSKMPTVHPKSCGRVLTSWESIQQLEQKKFAKEQKEHEKEERKKARLEKKLEKERLKKKKSESGKKNRL